MKSKLTSSVFLVGLLGFLINWYLNAFFLVAGLIVGTLFIFGDRFEMDSTVLIPLFIGIVLMAFDYEFRAGVTAYQLTISITAIAVLINPYLSKRLKSLQYILIFLFDAWILYIVSQYIHYEYYRDLYSVSSLERAKYLPEVTRSILGLVDKNVVVLLSLIPLVTVKLIDKIRTEVKTENN